MDWTPIATAFAALMVQWWQPFNVVLFLALAVFGHFLWHATHSPDFKLLDMLRDDTGKPSGKRVAYYLALIVSSWAVMQCAPSWLQQPHEFFLLLTAYMVVWAAPQILEIWVKGKYGGQNVPGPDQAIPPAH